MIEAGSGVVDALITVGYVAVVSAIFYFGYGRLERVLGPALFALLKRT